jgi:glutamine cyclotransferase
VRLKHPLIALFAALFLSGAAAPAPPAYVYQVLKTYPHDRNAFTQGLLILDGFLYESTGLNGQSSLRKVELETGKVVQSHSVPQQYFAEGLAHHGSDLIQLTWQSQLGFVYDRATFRQKRTFTYQGEGWGIANDGTRLVMSDGTAAIRFLDPQTLRETGRIQVTDRGRPVIHLNELEMVKGEIYANVWQTDRIARIDPRTGNVVGWINLAGLLSPSEQQWGAVLNGIAYDARADRLFVTGKLWPKLFEIRVVPQR